MPLPEGAIVKQPTRYGGYGDNWKGLEYEIDERVAFLMEANPEMNWVHARNKAKKEVTNRRIYALAKKQGNTKLMKAISVKQPWAWAIAHGHKTIETRTWPTNFRGRILIVSSKQPDRSMLECLKRDLDLDFTGQLEYGKAVAIANLVDCRIMTGADQNAALCDVYPKAHSWVLKDVQRIEPFAVTGKLSLYDVDVENKIKIVA